MLIRRLVIAIPLALILAVVTICTILCFVTYLLTGSGPMQTAINDFADLFNEVALDLIQWAK
jgi:hypothetical protein